MSPEAECRPDDVVVTGLGTINPLGADVKSTWSALNEGTCAVRIEFDVEDGVVKNVAFLGGCDGNHKGIAALVEGQKPEEVAKKLKGITCGRRTTSCPDQLALALEDFMKNQ